MSQQRPAGGARMRVAVIGAGFSGLAAAVELGRRGITDYVVFDEAEGVGGTWWKNRYPGAEVDLESHIYSFSFARHDWKRTHALWFELQEYLDQVADAHGVTPRLRLGERVRTATWDATENVWRLTTSTGADHGTFDAVISGVGFLNVPVMPSLAEDAADFPGTVCHTSSWPEGLSMRDRRVAVVGTGSSAVQVVSEAVREASQVTVFQSEPNWLLPKGSREFTPTERRWNRWAPVYRWRRWRLYVDYDRRQADAQHARTDGAANRDRRSASLDFLRRSMSDRPDLLAVLTPTFPFEARRTVISDTYYRDLKSPKVTLVPHRAARLTASGLQDATGATHDADIVVLATGFDGANYLSTLEVIGRDGVELHNVWKGEPAALYGLMVPGFPNFFMLYGPNTNAVPLPAFYEAQARFVGTVLTRLRRAGARTAEVKPAPYERFNRALQAQLARTVWPTTRSYFTATTGKVVSQWPYSATRYVVGTWLAARRDVELR